MSQSLSHVALLVRDYDEAIEFYTESLGFELIEDARLDANKRWILVRPRNGGTALLLARATTAEQLAAVGRAAGGRVAFFLHTDDFERDFIALRAREVRFTEEPRDEPYGRVVVFEDLYGNLWDLVEPRG